jgi:signal transduction histidine kinase
MGRLSEEARRHEVLVEAGLVLASELSLPVVLQKIVDLACEVADARYGAVGVLGPDGRIAEFITHGITNEQRERIGPLPEGHGLLGLLIKDPRPLRLRNIKDHMSSSGFPPNHPPMASFLGVPIAVRGRVFGNLYLTEKQGADEFTEGDESAVMQLAAQAAVAVENARLYTEAHRGQELLTGVNEVSRAILEGSEIEGVLRLIAGRARALVNARIATIVTPDGPDEKLIVRVAEGEGSDLIEGSVFSAEGSVAGEVMQTREAIMLADVSADSRVNDPIVRLGTLGPALVLPLSIGEKRFGVLKVANDRGAAHFTKDDFEVVQAFAGQAAVALEHTRIQGELKRLALVEDRERIAKELHDDIIQSLFAEGMALQATLSVLKDPDESSRRISQSVERIDRVIRDLRNYIFALKPGAAADRALERSLHEIARSFADASNIEIEVRADVEATARLSSKSSEVLQAVREAVSNAVRHSGADLVLISVARASDAALVEVSDNGAGFDVEQAAGKGHGLSNLRARAEALGGELDIESEQGRGTWVRLRIPL